MGKIKKIIENELVGGTQSTDIYPVTSIKAVYDESNERLDNILKKVSKFDCGECTDLSDAISKVPQAEQKGGMTIRFIKDNKYVSYTLSTSSWSDNPNVWEMFISSVNNDAADLDIKDENLNTILRLKKGEIQTKNFNSADVLLTKDSIIPFCISDENAHTILEIVNGNIITKNFNSTNTISDAPLNGEKYIRENGKWTKIYNSNINTFKGLRMSVIGDSTSTFEGYPKSGNNEYPVNSSTWASPVKTDKDMWWYKVANKMGMQIDTINAYGGRRFTTGGNYTSFIDAAKDFGSPDVVFIKGGINEILHTNGNSLGNYDFGNATDTSKLRHAIQIVINNIRTTLPNIKAIFFCTPVASNKDIFTAASNGISYYDIVDSIKEICDAYGVICIELHKCGITKNNQSTYLGDGIHPNGNGMNLISNFICSELTRYNINY